MSDNERGTQTAMITAAMPLCELLGVEVEKLEPDEVVFSIAWAPQLCTSSALLHGGALMALADSAGATLASLNLPQGSVGTSTIESKTNFLGAVRKGRVVAKSSCLHKGASTVVVETSLFNGERLVAKTLQTQSVLKPR